MSERETDVRAVARRLVAERFPGARAAFLSGSITKGLGTPHSDLDIVVIYDRLPRAWQESFHYAGWPVETWHHDEQTLAWFFENDAKAGREILAHMIGHGVSLVAEHEEKAAALQARARAHIMAGPPALSEEDRQWRRYMLTNLIDDLRAPRRPQHAFAAGMELYRTLADFVLRMEGKWSAIGKALPDRLRAHDADLAERHHAAFATLFSTLDTGPAIALAEEVLAHHGGRLWDMKRLAPEESRKK